MIAVDWNCDLGEGAGADAELLPWISTANVACGGHAGSPAIALETLELCVKHGVRAGAHPGYPDRANFGRVETHRPPRELFAECLAQSAALAALAGTVGITLAHLKPHGAMYHRASVDPAAAEAVAAAAAVLGLAVVGLPRSDLELACVRRGVPFIPEGFADRRYRPDGSLVPRTEPGALVTAVDEAAEQVMRLVRDHGVRTICVHGDSPRAAEFVRGLRGAMARTTRAASPHK